MTKFMRKPSHLAMTAMIAISINSLSADSAVAQGESVQAVTPGSDQSAGTSTLQPENDPVKTCMAAKSMEPVVKKKRGPVRMIFKGLASETGTDMSNMLKDSMFVFSAKDFDPYEKGNPKDKPYTALEIRYTDGSSSALIKYPDNSAKIQGGFADGTIVAPVSPNEWIVAYPNGFRGKLVKAGGEFKIYRPDNTITTMKQTAGGGFTISNSKLGYMGTARSDTLGMQYEMGSKDF